MKLTCVTATFNVIKSGNRENLIRCVRSVAALKTEHEHLIYDGGSTDGTVELLRELKSTTHSLVVVSEPDTGIYNTRNCQGAVAGCSQETVKELTKGAVVVPVVAPEMAPVVAPEHRLPQNTQGRILQVVQKGEMSRQQLADSLGVVRKARSLKMAINELLSDGLLELSHPENPNDRRQTYRLTAKGIGLLNGRAK